MRLTGGRLRGRGLEALPGGAIRPTADRVREALFNRLTQGGARLGGRDRVRDAVVLDAFVGTAALCLEALSRGAAEAYGFDIDPRVLAVARRNVTALGVDDVVRLLRADATRPPAVIRPATLAFLDPPYRSDLAPAALSALSRAGWLVPDCLCVVEHDQRSPPDWPSGFDLLDRRDYGHTAIAFLVHGLQKGEGAGDAGPL